MPCFGMENEPDRVRVGRVSGLRAGVAFLISAFGVGYGGRVSRR